jgi:hypothetical protein
MGTCYYPWRVSYGNMHNIHHDNLGLVKKSARWVPKLLSEDQKKEHVKMCKEFVSAVSSFMEMLENIVTMDETMVSYHTPLSKAVKTVVKEGKARTH